MIRSKKIRSKKIRIKALRIPLILATVCLSLLVLSQTTAKRPLNHHDYDGWRSITNPTLSRDGKYLAYGLFPQEGDGEVIVRNLATNQEFREKAGERPQPVPPDPGAAEDAPPQQRGITVAFTADSSEVVFSVFPAHADVAQAKKDKKRADEMPKGAMVIMSLPAGTAVRVASVKSFQVPSTGLGYMAYLKEAPPGAGAAGAAPAAPGDDAERDEHYPQADQQGRGGRGGAAAGGARGRNQYGTELVLRKTSDATEKSFADVTEYSFARDAQTVVYTVASRKTEADGVYAVTPGSDTVATLLTGKGKYNKLTWDGKQSELAFVSDRDDVAAKQPKWKIYTWDRKSGAATETVTNATPGIMAGNVISDRGQLRFSRDDRKLFLAVAPPRDEAPDAEPGAAPAAPAAGANDDKVSADLWHWKDDHIQPVQKLRAASDRNRTYVAVYDVGSKKITQLTGPEMIAASTNEQGTFAFGTDDRAYRVMADYEPGNEDLYLINTASGERKLLSKKSRGRAQWSPDGKYGVLFDSKDWNSISTTDGKFTNLTAKLNVKFENEEHDTPDQPNAYGSGGFTADGKSVLLYDYYDVWQVALDGSSAKNLTAGAGRRGKLRLRVINFPNEEEDGEIDRGLDTTQPLLLRAENMDTHDTGYYCTSFTSGAAPEKLLMAARNFGNAAGGRGGAGGASTLIKARKANVVVVSAGTFNEFPNLNVTDTSFKSLKKVTDANPQQAGLLWGTSEIVHFKNSDGVPLSAAMYKPENFDPKKKYPMMIYIYERLSGNVHNFVNPAPGTSINIAYYVSNGYIVLTPDIVYTTGYPGQSALKCVLPAIQTVVDNGYVNENAIGIQGHSWGGYQIAYMITQTSRFRAAEAGAPVANMISAYDGIRWGTGVPRQFQYEHTQSRIGGTPWQYPERYIQNSPIFQADRVTTPLLMIHNDADTAVPWQQGIEYFLALRRLGKEVYMFVYNGEPHGLQRRPDQKDYTVRMQQYFDYFLKSAPEPDWMKNGIPYLDREQEKERTKVNADK